ncbi:BatD family protein [Microbulbifer guangxiensis]|uniref:BatD family protein n=1 Tax=Microbulbifer guangxiensis TaxID=2904249 RepID=UPI001F2A1633|nr:BatD family protein [Microbulbifer guangxiensis]
MTRKLTSAFSSRNPYAAALLLCLLFALGLPTTVMASDLLSATVDRNEIGIDETLNLRLRYSGTESGGQPDFELLEQDFDILSRQQSNQYRVINGRAESFVEWMLVLAPKREGKLFIPSLHYHGEVSDAIPITITEAGSRPDAVNRQAFLEVELDKKEIFVQEQLLVKVRLYTTIGLHDIATEALQVPGAHVEKVDEQRYERRINGVGHAVYELTYAIFPESSGKLTIPALNYVAVAGRRDPFSLFNRNTQRLRLRSEPQTIQVNPKPDTYTGTHWLPAASLGIVQSWSQDPDTFTVGEPITRILTLRAEGLRAAQLPPLPQLNVDGLKTYPDQPQQDDQVSTNGITGSRIETTAIVATKPGDYQLPPITITWWDTKTGRQRATQLPAFRFKVIGSAAATNTAPPGSAADLVPQPRTAMPADNFWRNLALAAIAAHLLWVFYYFWLQKQQGSSLRKPHPTNAGDKGKKAKELKRACQGNEPKAIQAALVRWVHARWPHTAGRSLAEASRLLQLPELTRLQSALDSAIYSSPARPLNQKEAQMLVDRLLRSPTEQVGSQQRKALPELF